MIKPTRMALTDLADEALTGILARPGRSLLTVLGTLLGIAAFVSVLGLTATAQGQISKRFTALAATEVTVEDAATDRMSAPEPAFPDDTEQRLARMDGVASSGLFWTAAGGASVSARPPRVGAQDIEQFTVTAATPGYLHAIHAEISAGRTFDGFHHATAQPVALLGRATAARLGVTRIDAQPAIFIDGIAVTVIGIIDDVDRQAETLLSVIIPAGTAERLWGAPTAGAEQPAKVLIETELGAAAVVGQQAPYALNARDPDRLKVVVPPDPQELKSAVGTDLATLFLLLAAVSLIIGAVGIANTTLVAVLERVPEIGLRRSLGARGSHIASQFLSESATLGLLGGLIGTSTGVLTVVTVAIARDWTPILEPWAVLPAPLIGATTGLLAGLYPAWRAARVEPVEALRR